VREQATFATAHLALDNSRNQVAIASSGAVPILATLLSTTSPAQQWAVITVGCMADIYANHKRLRDSGIHLSIAQLLCDASTDGHLRGLAARATALMAQDPLTARAIVTTGGPVVDVLCNALLTESDEVVQSAIDTLRQLGSHEDTRDAAIAQLRSAHGMVALVHVLFKRPLPIALSALDLVLDMFPNSLPVHSQPTYTPATIGNPTPITRQESASIVGKLTACVPVPTIISSSSSPVPVPKSMCCALPSVTPSRLLIADFVEAKGLEALLMHLERELAAEEESSFAQGGNSLFTSPTQQTPRPLRDLPVLRTPPKPLWGPAAALASLVEVHADPAKLPVTKMLLPPTSPRVTTAVAGAYNEHLLRSIISILLVIAPLPPLRRCWKEMGGLAPIQKVASSPALTMDLRQLAGETLEELLFPRMMTSTAAGA